jgi:hypothetical protein
MDQEQNMFKWKKMGLVFDPRQHKAGSLMQEFAQSASVLVFDKFVRVYFSSRPPQTSDGRQLSYLFHIDLDRQDLLKIVNIGSEPILTLGALGTFDEFGTNPLSVIQHKDEIRIYYAGYTRCESVPFNAAIGVAVSRDGGVSFTRLGDGPVLPYGPDEPFLHGSPRIRRFGDKWHLWYVAGREWLRSFSGRPEPVYKIRMASSDDGLEWVKLGRDLIEDKLGINECQASPDVTFRNGKYHMFFSYRHSHNYTGKEGGYRIGYASSTDMVTWHRRDELAGLTTSANGWDSEMASYPHLFTLDGQTYMLYQGNGMGRDGIGLAKLDASSTWGYI